MLLTSPPMSRIEVGAGRPKLRLWWWRCVDAGDEYVSVGRFVHLVEEMQHSYEDNLHPEKIELRIPEDDWY